MLMPVMVALIVIAIALVVCAVFLVGFAVGHASAVQQINEATAIWSPQPRRRGL